MAARGPRSAASLTVVAATIDSRPQPPEDLNEAQQEIWRRIVASEPAEQFKTVALQILLRDLCRHAEASQMLAKFIDKFRDEWLLSGDGVDRYQQLLGMRERETKAVADRATKLRLTNQSRYTPLSAATAVKHASTAAKPWEKFSNSA